MWLPDNQRSCCGIPATAQCPERSDRGLRGTDLRTHKSIARCKQARIGIQDFDEADHAALVGRGRCRASPHERVFAS